MTDIERLRANYDLDGICANCFVASKGLTDGAPSKHPPCRNPREHCLAVFRRTITQLRAELEAAKAFKTYVHKRLDDASVPVDPPSVHRERGCRIGGRLDLVLAAQARVKELEEALRIQDPRNASERYDLIADDFYRKTGWWAPGRSIPAAVGLVYSEEEEAIRAKEWRAFCNKWHEDFFDAALFKEKPHEPPE